MIFNESIAIGREFYCRKRNLSKSYISQIWKASTNEVWEEGTNEV